MGYLDGFGAVRWAKRAKFLGFPNKAKCIWNIRFKRLFEKLANFLKKARELLGESLRAF